jgi:diguanylate cyclase (GGDEF)-like protein/PAS domain S-box-containing protein
VETSSSPDQGRDPVEAIRHLSPAGPDSAPDPMDMDYRALLERIPAITYIAGFGESGTWDYVSPQIESILGFSPAEWQTDPDLWYRQIHPGDRARALEDEATSKMTGEPLVSEYRMLTAAGRTIWVRDEAVLVRDHAGQPVHWQGFMIDITGRKQTEDALAESETRYRGLFDHVPVGLYRTTPDGRLMDGNRALAQILGYTTREALLAADATEFYVDPGDRDRWKALVEAEGLVRDFELQLRRADGSVIWVRDSGRAVRGRDEQILYYEGALQDITMRKQAEWEARQANQQLSSWVGELERRNTEMTMINEMADMLQSCPTAEEAHTVMAHWAEQMFAGRSGALYVIAPSRNLVEPVAVWGNGGLADSVFAPDGCWALRTGRPHLVKDPASRLICRHLSEQPRAASLCVPMMAQGEALGILHLQAETGWLTVSDGPAQGIDSLKQLAVTVAEHLALALANLKLRETLRTQSIRDPLTKLFNRRYMEESLERELRRAERRSHGVGVIMLDLDHFSRFNNTFGHQAGDMLLQAFGELVRQRIRGEDIACRYGGEEFLLIMPEAPPEVVVQRADALRQELRELRLEFRGQSLGTVTTSAGVAMFPEHGSTAESIINSADVALYRAKAEGRDRVVAAEPGATLAPGSLSA